MNTRPSSRKTRAGEANTQRISMRPLRFSRPMAFKGRIPDRDGRRIVEAQPALLLPHQGGSLYRRASANLDMWLEPLQELDSLSDPRVALSAYITRKLDYSRSHPTAAPLRHGGAARSAAPNSALTGNLHYLVEAKSRIIETWIGEGRLRPIDPKPHLRDLGYDAALCRFRVPRSVRYRCEHRG